MTFHDQSLQTLAWPARHFSPPYRVERNQSTKTESTGIAGVYSEGVMSHSPGLRAKNYPGSSITLTQVSQRGSVSGDPRRPQPFQGRSRCFPDSQGIPRARPTLVYVAQLLRSKDNSWFILAWPRDELAVSSTSKSPSIRPSHWLPGVLIASIFQFDLGGLANPETSIANREASETFANI